MELTAEQREQFKMARRASMRIEETWSLYTMFLSGDKRPEEALERAQEAVAVWVEWMDHNEVEPPDIKRPDFTEEVGKAVSSMMEHMRTQPGCAGSLLVEVSKEGHGIDAEFLPISDGPEPKA